MKNKRTKFRTYYPVFLNLVGKKCVVIGGGEVALRKIRMLLDCGAKVAVVSPVFHPDLSLLAESRAIEVIQRTYEPEDLQGAVMLISATDDEKINQRVADEAKQRGVLINVVDDPARSDFIVPSYFRRGGLTIAVSTSGMSPALARKIRTKLEQDFGEEYASMLSLIEKVRSTLKDRGVTASADAWQETLDLDLLVDLVKRGREGEAKSILLEKLEVLKKDY
jgi:precorrin-2 dehydrogenase/sirohydrochlorin ferrochelatase